MSDAALGKSVRFTKSSHRQSGVTLMELLVAVAIIGILSAVAYPSYTQYVTRTNRAAAQSVLLQVADRQEQFFADNKTYASDLTDLGYASNGFMVDETGAEVSTGSTDRLYSITLTNTSALTFTANAAPQLVQATRDDTCQTLTLMHTGARGQTGTGDNCW